HALLPPFQVAGYFGGDMAIDFTGDRDFLARTESLAKGAPVDTGGLSDHGHFSARRTIRTDQSTPALGLVDRGEPGGGMRAEWRYRVRPLLFHRHGIGQ